MKILNRKFRGAQRAVSPFAEYSSAPLPRKGKCFSFHRIYDMKKEGRQKPLPPQRKLPCEIFFCKTPKRPSRQ